jgi:hypothetical protein
MEDRTRNRDPDVARRSVWVLAQMDARDVTRPPGYHVRRMKTDA